MLFCCPSFFPRDEGTPIFHKDRRLRGSGLERETRRLRAEGYVVPRRVCTAERAWMLCGLIPGGSSCCYLFIIVLQSFKPKHAQKIFEKSVMKPVPIVDHLFKV